MCFWIKVLHTVWQQTYWYIVSGTTLSSFPSSISTEASSIFAMFLIKRCARWNVHKKQADKTQHPAKHHHVHIYSNITHPFTPESDPGLKWTEDMVCVSSFWLCSERVVSAFENKSANSQSPQLQCKKERQARGGKLCVLSWNTVSLFERKTSTLIMKLLISIQGALVLPESITQQVLWLAVGAKHKSKQGNQ